MLLTSILYGPLDSGSLGRNSFISWRSFFHSADSAVLPAAASSCVRLAKSPNWATLPRMRSRMMNRSATLEGLFMWKLTCVSLGVSMRSTYRHTVQFSRRPTQNVVVTSLDVNGVPSLHLTPERSLTLNVSPPSSFHSSARTPCHLESAHRKIPSGAW